MALLFVFHLDHLPDKQTVIIPQETHSAMLRPGNTNTIITSQNTTPRKTCADDYDDNIQQDIHGPLLAANSVPHVCVIIL